RGLEIINFLWNPEALCIDIQQLKEMYCFWGFFEQEKDSGKAFPFENHLVLNNDQLAEIEKIHSRMLHEQETNRECGQLRMNCMLFEMLILVGRYYDKIDRQYSEGGLDRMEEIADFMEKNYSNHIQREDAAKIFGRSVRVFSEAFNKNFGMSFSDYLNKIRLRHARQMLIDTHLRVIDIALECGFCNNNYFCAVFKKFYGVTPQKYRHERT
ncbi:MAG: AraC family transcriptional regulator, partial [Lentisphaeria bacterium]|nr:AraC family transcriptional regulator [Lentisphaeria bacterium]